MVLLVSVRERNLKSYNKVPYTLLMHKITNFFIMSKRYEICVMANFGKTSGNKGSVKHY